MSGYSLQSNNFLQLSVVGYAQTVLPLATCPRAADTSAGEPLILL